MHVDHRLNAVLPTLRCDAISRGDSRPVSHGYARCDFLLNGSRGEVLTARYRLHAGPCGDGGRPLVNGLAYFVKACHRAREAYLLIELPGLHDIAPSGLIGRPNVLFR